MDEYDKCIRKKDLLFARNTALWLIVALAVVIMLKLWTIDVDTFIDDQIVFFNHDCKPHSQYGQTLNREDCAKARVYAENARWLVYLMYMYYGVVEGIGGIFELAISNMKLIGGTVVSTALGIAVRKYLMPTAWF